MLSLPLAFVRNNIFGAQAMNGTGSCAVLGVLVVAREWPNRRLTSMSDTRRSAVLGYLDSRIMDETETRTRDLTFCCAQSPTMFSF